MSRAYSECPATSIVTRRTTFLIAQAVTAALRNCEIRRKAERHAPRKIERFDHPDAAPEKVDNPEVHSGDAPIDVLRGVQVESATVSGISIRVGFAYAVNGRQVKSAREGTRKVGHLEPAVVARQVDPSKRLTGSARLLVIMAGTSSGTDFGIGDIDYEDADPSRRQSWSTSRNNDRSIASAITWYPMSFGCTWSPLS